MSSTLLLTCMYSTFYATVFMDEDNNTAFGPVIYGKTPQDAHSKAKRFLESLEKRFPYINIASINTQRLCIYYQEFLNETTENN